MWKLSGDFEYRGDSLPLSSIIQSTNLPFPLFAIDNKASRKPLSAFKFTAFNLLGTQGSTLPRQQNTSKEILLDDSLALLDLYINHKLPEAEITVNKISLLDKDTNLNLVGNLIEVYNFISLVEANTYLHSENFIHIHGNENILNNYLALSPDLNRVKLYIEFNHVKVVNRILKDNTVLLDLTSLSLSSILSITSKGLTIKEDSTVSTLDKNINIRYTYDSADKQLRIYNSQNSSLRLNDPITIEGVLEVSFPNITTVRKTLSLSTKSATESIYGINYLNINSVTYYRRLLFSNSDLSESNINLLLFNKYANLAWCI
jgi:hypothetical protein